MMWRRKKMALGFRAGFRKGGHDPRAAYVGAVVGIAIGLVVLCTSAFE